MSKEKKRIEDALGSLSGLPSKEKILLRDEKNEFFQIKSKPKPGEWLYIYNEEPQPFKTFKKYNELTRKKNKIYIYPFEKSNYDLNPIQHYISSFFYGVEVKLMKDLNQDMKKITSRSNESGEKQLLTSELFKILLKVVPEDSYW